MLRIFLRKARNWLSYQMCKRWDTLTQTVDAQVPPSTSPKCTFSGVVAIDLQRFADSGVALVECPACSRMRSLSPHKGVLRFPSHDRRKMQTPVTGVRWAAQGKTDWGVVGGEHK